MDTKDYDKRANYTLGKVGIVPEVSEDLPALPAVEAQPAQHLIDLAVEVSSWSPCQSKRGVVVFRGADVVSHGYNYKPRGFDCDGSAACKATCRDDAVHAEQQALLHAGFQANGCDLLHVKSIGGQLVASGGPSCVQCSKLVVACGIKGVWLYHADGWRRYEAAEFHRLSLEAVIAAIPSPQTWQQTIAHLQKNFDEQVEWTLHWQREHEQAEKQIAQLTKDLDKARCVSQRLGQE